MDYVGVPASSFKTGMLLKLPLAHILVLLGVALPYFINIGESSIWDANEAFYAETPREMLVSGNYLAPHFNFEPRAQKPPLTYWAILASYKLFGINEFAVRLPSALGVVGLLLFAYGLGQTLFGSRVALMTAIITGTTARIFILARRLPIDSLLLLFLTGTLYFLIRGIQKGSTPNLILAYLMAGLGFLTKGPVAIFIPAGTWVCWALWARRFRLSALKPLAGVPVFLLVVLPWYVAIYKAYGWVYISPFFLRDNFGRFAAESLGPSRSSFYYLSIFLVDFFPWSILTVVALVLLWIYRNDWEPLRSLHFGMPVFLCLLVFLFFSASKNKQEYYIAPMYPVAAMILSAVLDKYCEKKSKWESGQHGDQAAAGPDRPATSEWFWIFKAVAILLFLISLLLPFILRSFLPGINPVLHYGPPLILIGAALLMFWAVMQKRLIHGFQTLAAAIWTVYVFGALFYVPALEPFRPVKEFCRYIRSLSSGDEAAGYFRTALPSMAFYLQRPIFEESNTEQMTQRFRSDKRVFCVLTKRDFEFFADKQSLLLYVLDRRPRFSVRFRSILGADYVPEELLLVSNRPSEAKPGADRPVS
jgi:4-amino-4-deoxy-L-arabinose transferase-like glycosyltransferase